MVRASSQQGLVEVERLGEVPDVRGKWQFLGREAWRACDLVWVDDPVEVRSEEAAVDGWRMRAIERDLLREVDPDEPAYLANDRDPGSGVDKVGVLPFE